MRVVLKLWSHLQNPERFIPERWLEGTPEAAAQPTHGWCPFGDGVRACIGTRFALAVRSHAEISHRVWHAFAVRCQYMHGVVCGCAWRQLTV